ncbi:MAG: hypothetical protein ACKV2Q_21920 [Planctomycetaceae bacterium]
MANKQCPICGEQTLDEKCGTYRFDPPPNIPGGTMVISETTWEHCSSCGEDILSLALEAAINREQSRRQGLLLPGLQTSFGVEGGRIGHELSRNI